MTSHIRVDIGVHTAYEYFFDVVLKNKNEFFNRRTSLSAINAILSMWHMHDWYFYDNNRILSLSKKKIDKEYKKYKKDLFKECNVLEWLNEISNSSKHCHLASKKSSSDLNAQKLGKEYIWESSSLSGPYKEMIIEVDGVNHNLNSVLNKAFLYWIGRIIHYHVCYRITSPEFKQIAEEMNQWCKEEIGDDNFERNEWALLKGAGHPDYIGKHGFLFEEKAEEFARIWIGGIKIVRMNQ